jgi:integrase
MTLTSKKIEQHKQHPGLYLDGGDLGQGLYLQVTKGGASWLFRYEIKDQSPTPKRKDGRRERWMGLGSLKTFTLKEARDRARQKRQMLADGIDPLEQKKSDKAAAVLASTKIITFENAAQQYFDQHEKEWRSDKHRQQFLSSLKQYAFPKIGNFPVADIDTAQVLKVIDPHWATKTETANRVRNRIEAVLSWATVRGYRTGDNPARWKGHLGEVLSKRSKIQKVEHHPALPYSKTSEFIAALHQRQGVAAAALEFLVLTAARSGEIIGARWDEIDWTAKVWTVPANRIKGGRLHRVPLSDRALAILQDEKRCPREQDNSHVFIGLRKGTGLGNLSMAAVLKRMGHRDITIHGFRSTFRTWGAEQTSFPREILEAALAHAIGDSKTEASYQHSDLLEKRRQLMAHWAEYCSMPTKSAGEVVPIRTTGGGEDGLLSGVPMAGSARHLSGQIAQQAKPMVQTVGRLVWQEKQERHGSKSDSAYAPLSTVVWPGLTPAG